MLFPCPWRVRRHQRRKARRVRPVAWKLDLGAVLRSVEESWFLRLRPLNLAWLALYVALVALLPILWLRRQGGVQYRRLKEFPLCRLEAHPRKCRFPVECRQVFRDSGRRVLPVCKEVRLQGFEDRRPASRVHHLAFRRACRQECREDLRLQACLLLVVARRLVSRVVFRLDRHRLE